MSINKKFVWLKLKDNFFNEPKIKKLRRIAGGDTYTVIYLKMMLLSIKNGGIIEFQGIEKTLQEELSLILDESDENIKATIVELTKLKMAESNDYYIKPIKVVRDRNTTDYKNWRSSVFIRDNFTCQHCYIYGVKLNAHHIKKWSDFEELRFDINNGITLCTQCHKNIHSFGGVN